MQSDLANDGHVFLATEPAGRRTHESSPDGPHATPGEVCLSWLDWFARAGALVVALVGAVVLAGWLLGPEFPHGALRWLTTMKANTACAFLAAGVALWCLHTSPARSYPGRLGRALSLMVAALGALTLSQYAFGLELGIDQILVLDDGRTSNVLHAGRMSPATALNFIMVGLALATLKAREDRLAVWAHRLAVVPLFVATLAGVGHAYGVSALYELGPYTPLAAHTAVSFIVVTLSLLAADHEHGMASIAGTDSAGGVVCRQLLPTIPVVLIVLGWVRLAGQQAGLYDTRFGTALMVLLSITVCVIAVGSTAATLHQVDVNRKIGQSEILTLNATLEQRVGERTEQLERVSAELLAANRDLEQLALHDGLTELPNRRFFDQYLADQVAVIRRHQRSLALVLCDVDSFKAYNDRYGHPAGDECLKQVAAALRSCCRRPADRAARYGGEEFAIVLPETDLFGAAQIAEAARDAVERLRIPHEGSPAAPHVSISGGVAVMGGDMSVPELIMAADQSLYQAKQLGRNRMVSVQAEAGAEDALRAEGESALHGREAATGSGCQ